MGAKDKEKYNSFKWYDADVIFEVRLLIFKSDNKAKLSKKAHEKRTNKFTSETDAELVIYIYIYIYIFIYIFIYMEK